MKETLYMMVVIIGVFLVTAIIFGTGYEAGKSATYKELQNFIIFNDGNDYAKGDVEYEYYKKKGKERAAQIVIELLKSDMRKLPKEDKET
jgi:hypothetical protein